ncbi:MAG: hypothetical protein ACLGI6_09100, partial [Gammaproteobacteria bacterium]
LVKLQSLGVRMERHAATTATLLAHLLKHEAVEAAMPVPGCAALLHLTPKGGSAAARRLVGTLRLFARDERRGGAVSSAWLDGAGVQLSVGLEAASDLIDDLAHALRQSQKGA